MCIRDRPNIAKKSIIVKMIVFIKITRVEVLAILSGLYPYPAQKDVYKRQICETIQ